MPAHLPANVRPLISRSGAAARGLTLVTHSPDAGSRAQCARLPAGAARQSVRSLRRRRRHSAD
eukprot:509022-Hanusia_phi.AAC.3